MDRLDRKILRLLQEDATLAVADIAKKVGLSTTPCWRGRRHAARTTSVGQDELLELLSDAVPGPPGGLDRERDLLAASEAARDAWARAELARISGRSIDDGAASRRSSH